MTLEEIDDMVKNRNSLTEDQKKQVRDAILNNDTARQKAINGAILTGDYSLAYQLSLMTTA